MRITVKQRGGFVGDEVTLVQVDTAALRSDQRDVVERQVEASGVLSGQREAAVGADLLAYEIAVEDEGRRRVVTWVDDGAGAAEPVQRLVAQLSAAQ